MTPVAAAAGRCRRRRAVQDGAGVDAGGFWSRFRRNTSRGCGSAIFLVLVVVVVASSRPCSRPTSPTSRTSGASTSAVGRTHWLGTDDLGRDMLSRLIFGARLVAAVACQASLAIALLHRPAARARRRLLGRLGRHRDHAGHRRHVQRSRRSSSRSPSWRSSGRACTERHHRHRDRVRPGLVRLVRGQVLAVREETLIEAPRSHRHADRPHHPARTCCPTSPPR